MYAPPNATAKFGTYTASYNTDLSYFKNAGKKILFGGGTIADAHIDDEFIEIAALASMPLQYEEIIHELLTERSAAS
jgi:acetylornithine deacetylase/succinyl-diaminopimelate desuccinylase-like protein